MRVTLHEGTKTHEYPKLLSYRGMTDPLVVLAFDAQRSVVIRQGGGSSNPGALLTTRCPDLWEPYAGAVTRQN